MHALINKTTHSHGRSTMKVSQLVSLLSERKVTVAAITDLHSLSGVPEFLLLCEKSGIHGIAGVTININNGETFCGELTLLADGDHGYAALMAIIDEVKHITDFKEFSSAMGLQLKTLLSGDMKELFQYTVCIDGYPGSVGEYFAKELPKPSLETVTEAYLNPNERLFLLKSQFSEGGYLGGQLAERKSVIAAALSDPRLRIGIPEDTKTAVQTTVAMALNADELPASQQLFMNAAQKWLLQFPEGAQIPYIQRVYKDKFLDIGERPKPEGIFAGQEQLIGRLRTPKSAYKTKPVTDLMIGELGDEPTLSDLMNQAWPKFKEKLLPTEIADYSNQIRHELSIVKKLGFENYFLNIHKIKMVTDKLQGNAVMLRGSAVGSLIMHVLDLSPVDPMKNGLLFARFLSEYRNEEPDVDMEFMNPVKVRRALPVSFDNRMGAINPQFASLSDYNGVANAFELLSRAQKAVENFIPLTDSQKKSYERAFDILTSYAYNRGTKIFNTYGKGKVWEEQQSLLEQIVKKMPNFKELSSLYTLAKAISQGTLSSKVSAASIVIIPEGAGNHFNLLRSKSDATDDDLVRIPMTKYALPATGFIKYDILSNHSFKRTRNTIALLGLPSTLVVKNDDPVIGYLFKKKAFLGICQLNAYAGDRLANQMMPSSYEDLTAIFALIRDASGKQSDEMIETYLNNKKNPDQLNLPDGLMPILKETHGALLYEEQLMKILTDVGGFSWTRADAFRSSLKKGKYDIIAEYENEFLESVQSKYGLTREQASPWYQPLRDKHGRFVFSKAHAVAYAHLAVQQCYLKCKYPAAYSAELYMDKIFKFKGSKVTLLDVLQNWSLQLIKKEENGVTEFHKTPQTMLDFVDYIGDIVMRERPDPETEYKVRDLSTIRLEIEEISGKLASMGLAPASITPDKMKKLLLERFDEKISGVTTIENSLKKTQEAHQNTTIVSLDRTNKSKSAKSNGSLLNDFSDESIRDTLADDASPLNSKKEINLSKDVMIGHFLWFLSKSGIITQPSVNTDKSASNDHYRFSGKTSDGNVVSYHISAISLSPERASKSTRSMTSGCFQGGQRNAVGIMSAEHLMVYLCHDGIIPGAPKVEYVPNNKESGKFEEVIEQIRPFLYAMVKSSKVPLYGLESLKSEFSASSISDPLFSILYARTPTEIAKYQTIQKETLETGRGFDPAYFKHLFENQSLMFGTKFGKLMPSNREPGKTYRMETKNIFAQFRMPDGKTPIWKLPMPKDGEFASGGHQSIFWSAKTSKVSRPDHATNRILGHFYGDPTPGSLVLWVTEGIFDSMAFNELQHTLPAVKGDVPWAEPNSISIKSAGGAVRFLNKTLGIKMEFPKHQGVESFDFIMDKSEQELLPIPDQYINMLTSWIKSRTLHWVDDPSKPQSTQMIKSLISTLKLSATEIGNHFKLHNMGKNSPNYFLRDVYKIKMTNENDVLLHPGNIDQWMHMNRLKFAPSLEMPGEFEIKLVQDKKAENIRFSSMTKDQKENVSQILVEKFRSLTGSMALGSALDGDEAGLSETRQLKLFAESIGLPFATFIPIDNTMEHPKTGEKMPLKDHNDYLKVIRRFQKEQLFGPLFKLISEYHASYKVPDPKLMPSIKKSRTLPQDNPSVSNVKQKI